MAVNLLRCLKQRNVNEGGDGAVEKWWPEFDIEGDWVTLTEIDVRSIRHAAHERILLSYLSGGMLTLFSVCHVARR